MRQPDLDRVPRLTTARLTLRRFEEGDLDALVVVLSDSEVARHLGSDGAVPSRTEVWRALAAYLGHWALRGYGPFAVEEQATGRLVGRVGLWRPEGWPDLELIWTVARDRWGRDYAGEAARAAREWAGAALGPVRIVSYIRPTNGRSRRVAAKLGARQDGEVVLMGATAEVWLHPVVAGQPARPTPTGASSP